MRQATPSTPILNRGAADPFIVATTDGYYLYATGKAEDGRFIPIYHSPDLVSWRFVRGAVERGPAGAWNRRNFWAPEVLVLDGRYYLYYTASPDGTPGNTGNRVGLAVADRPEGPFAAVGPVIAHPSLDGSPFRDDDGTLYLYYTAEFGNSGPIVPGRIYVDRLADPSHAAGLPVELVRRYPWQEGPCVLRRGGRSFGMVQDLATGTTADRKKGSGTLTLRSPTPFSGLVEPCRYFLFYSVGNWGDATYHVRWAVGDRPTGPFEESPTVLLQTSEHVIGPGHHNFFRGPDGADWVVFHGWDPGHTARYPRLARLEWRDGRPRVESLPDDRPATSQRTRV